MNRLTIIGNLTRAPETRVTTSGLHVCTFTVAVNRRKTQNNPEPGADYFRVSAWRQLADNCQQYLDKGRKVAVTGPVTVSTYTGNDGTTRATLEVTADGVEFLSPRGESTVAPAAHATQAQADGYTEVTDDDLPF